MGNVPAQLKGQRLGWLGVVHHGLSGRAAPQVSRSRWADNIKQHESAQSAERIMPDSFENEIGKLRWQRWDYKAGQFASLKSAGIPCRYGVYVIRGPSPLSRVRGSSNVVYIGQSGGGKRRGKQGIGPGNGGLGRLFNTRGSDKIVRAMVEELFPDQRFTVECAFDDHNDTKLVEQRLLHAYLRDHCELPPANHSGVAQETDGE